MGYPEDYPDEFRESIFAWTHHSENDSGGAAGRQTFVFTRAGSRLKVYVLQYVASHPDGDLVHLYGSGSIGDLHYDPSDDDSFIPADMNWDRGGRPRLSQPVRDWLDQRDYVIADPGPCLEAIAHEKNIDIE